MGRQREKKRKSSGSVDGEAPPVDAQTADDGSGERVTTLAELDARINPPRVEEGQDLEGAPVGETPPEDETRRLRERIRTLDIQLDTARVRENELTGQVVALEGNVEDLRTQVGELAAKGEEIGSLKTEIAAITETLDNERRRASELAGARNGLEEEANRLSSQVTQLTEMIDEAKSDVVAEATRAGAAEDLLAALRDSHESLARERDDARDEVEDVTRRLQVRLDELAAELEPLHEEARSADARALEHERTLERMQTTVKERDEELGRLRDHIAALEARLEDGQSALAARETELGEQQEALRALRDEAERREAETLEAAASDRAAAERNLAASEARASGAEQAANQAKERATAAEARVTQTEQRATQAEQTATSLGNELGAARAALSNLENAHDAIRMRAADLQTEVEHKLHRVNELEDQLATKAGSDAEVDRLSAELEQIRTDLEDAKAEAAAAASSAEAAQAEREAALERIAELEGNVEELQRGGAQHEAARDLDEVRAQLVDAQGELGRANAVLSTARSDMANLEREYEALRTVELPSLSDASAKLLLERDEARSEIEQLRNRLAGVESSIGEDQALQAASDGDGRGAIADLELRLEQAEMRARRAYSASEAAEAALAYEKERRMSLAPTVEAETEANELRNRVSELLDRVDVAVDARRKAEADLAAFRAGVEPREADEEIGSSTAGRHNSDEDATGPSLRARLAGAASSRKGSSGDADHDTDQWR